VIDFITPVILTYNEALNIARTLDALAWARDIVVVDSFSDDGTLDILKRHPNVRLFQRAFDSHARQWNFAISETGICTSWILALDADYVLTPSFVHELSGYSPQSNLTGYWCRFAYCVGGVPLAGALYPPVIALYRVGAGRYDQDGHTQRIIINGAVGRISSPILHDDRKPLSRWLQSQSRYAKLEAEKLIRMSWSELAWNDRIRKLVVLAPPLVFAYCLIGKGGLLKGRVGLFYALQRTVAELLLSLSLLEATIAGIGKGRGDE
jgi:glycosyltransferase involved in cell wall biosynthesis